VIRRGDDDRIDVGPRQQLPVVPGRHEVRPELLLRPGGPAVVRVGRCHEGRARHSQGGLGVARPHVTDADCRELDAIVGRDLPAAGNQRVGHGQRHRRGGTEADELTTGRA
jgi:hypothetical protein